jgi:hypothetical protein
LADQVDDHYKKLIKENNIYAQYVSPTGTNKQTVVEKIKFIKQGSVSSNVSDGKLFKEDGNFYKTIPTLGSFSEQINQYYDELISFIQFQIGKKRKYDSLSEHYFEITTTNSIAMFYPSIVINLNQENNTDNDEKRLQTMTNLYDEINNEYKKNRKYYISLHAEETIEQVVKLLASIIDTIKAVLAKKKISNQCKQIVSNALRNLSVNLNKKRSSEEQKQQQRISARESLISSVVDYYSTVINELDFPSFPQAIKGESINSNFGYTFFQTARYHEKNLKNDFYKFCFNKDYQNEEAIKSIETEDQLSQALAYYSSDNVVEFKNSKVNKFIQEYSRTTTKITDDFSLSVGNTPGEVAKVFYKFITTQMKEQYHVLIIDQPEDDINPKGIQTMLNEFLGSIRDSKQVILITHSPLLVVNLDVDNVIYVNKEGQSISIEEGPLEFVNNKYSILDLVRDNLDGGYDAIKRRLKVYDDDNN